MDPRPNLLLVTTDHWPGSLLGIAGHPVIQTPTLDQLARSGVRFTNAYSECPVCIPARRTLLTGTNSRSHGDRTFEVELPMPDVPSVANVFRDHGYQTYCVGKLHVYPPRVRAGFDDVILSEEGRPQYGPTDDYELFLGDQGFAGQQFLHGMSNNDYVHRPWHLPEHCHVTNWSSVQMSRMIQRRDPTRPAFWYLSYTHPHPPLVPLESYLDVYRQLEPPLPYYGQWPRHRDRLPCRMNNRLIETEHFTDDFIRSIRRAFYALCTHIDHQLRVVIGTLREENILDNTVILFTSDHGDMLGNHGLWAKRLFYEDATCVPMILVGTARDTRVGYRRVDNRLIGLQDVMPTLLDLAGIPIPDSVDGRSVVGDNPREHLYGEYGAGVEATRMLHDGRHKLIYYASGNQRQLFDMAADPHELVDLAGREDRAEILGRLTTRLVECLYGDDLAWISDGKLIGLPEETSPSPPNRTLSLQRGSHWPVPPQS